MKMLTICCGTCGSFDWDEDEAVFKCLKNQEYVEYWDVPCDNYNYERGKDWAPYAKSNRVEKEES